MSDLYADRKLSAGYPDLERLAFEQFNSAQRTKPDDTPRIEGLLRLLGRLIILDGRQSVCVVGCGPVPQPIRILRDKGYDVASFVQDLRTRAVTPHIAINTRLMANGKPRTTQIDGRTTRHAERFEVTTWSLRLAFAAVALPSRAIHRRG